MEQFLGRTIGKILGRYVTQLELLTHIDLLKIIVSLR